MSDVTEILTGRINLKRLTAYVLDGITPSYAGAFDRGVVRSSRMEVQITGATVPVLGTVYIEGNGGNSLSEYVLLDRSLGTNWSVRILYGTISITSTISSASAEPIVEDSLVPGDHYRIFIDNGILGIENIGTVQDDTIYLKDSSDPLFGVYLLQVSNGVAGVASQNNTTETFIFSGDGLCVGLLDFDSLNSITSFGIVGGSISVRAISNMGQPINQLTDVATDLPVRFYAQSGRIRMLKSGQDKIAKYKIMAEPDADIRDKDMLYTVSGCFGLTYGQIDFVEKFYDFDGNAHHTEAEIVDL